MGSWEVKIKESQEPQFTTVANDWDAQWFL